MQNKNYWTEEELIDMGRSLDVDFITRVTIEHEGSCSIRKTGLCGCRPSIIFDLPQKRVAEAQRSPRPRGASNLGPFKDWLRENGFKVNDGTVQ